VSAAPPAAETGPSATTASADPAARHAAHVPVLDGIRGLAILLVLLCHLTMYGGEHRFDGWIDYLAWWGAIGVDLFFVLSGYLITGILVDARGRPGYFKNFYARRVLRIFPLYYAVVALSLLVLPRFLPPAQAARFGKIAGDEPYYWLYLQNFSIARAGQWRHGVLDVTWSLAIEEQFYLVWPTVVFLCSARAMKRLCAALFLVALVSRAVAARWLHLPAFSVYVLTPCRLDALAAGAYLAVRAREPSGLRALVPLARRLGPAAGGAALGIVVLEYAADLVTNYDAGWGPYSVLVCPSLVALAFASLLVVVVEAERGGRLHRAFASRWVCFFGVYSYGLYLVHLPIRALVADRVYGPAWRSPRHVFLSVGGTEILGQLLFYPLALAAIVPVAWLSYHLYEKQFLKLKRYFGDAPRAAAAE
jgi:peptidoglycan/LPS O-acetylase OafA/YrhL